MQDAFIEVPLSPDDPERYRRLAELIRATKEGERLRSLRWAVTVLLVVFGPPLALLHHSERSDVRHGMTALAGLWLGLVVAAVRLLWLERRNRRLACALLQHVHGRRR
jgi:hypothetical protein